ncbi:hypothetical protein [Burkholderia sp. L27(2015)]|uniref:hypothetical protein n=1 Tax=Burkholderia sp. L27(2015) TaxID=1641858 RepID=UPI00131D5B61|nr:hypothetical protein [Burkholderia sp. L27(2015)]
MNGWTRIWVVLTVVVGASSGWTYVENAHYAQQQADDAYKNALDNYDSCHQATPQPQTGVSSSQPLSGDTGPKSDLFSTLLSARSQACDGTEQPRDQYAKLQAQKRDAAITAANTEAADSAISTVGWISGTVGALFIAVGWVRRGFRRKKRS